MSTRNAGRQLIKAALDAGFTVAVHYESDDKPAMTRDGLLAVPKAIVGLLDPNGHHLNDLWSEATACDEATVYITDHDKQSMGWAYLVHWNEGDEVISDHGSKGWVKDWCMLTEYGQNGSKVVHDHDNGGFKTVRPVKDGVW